MFSKQLKILVVVLCYSIFTYAQETEEQVYSTEAQQEGQVTVEKQEDFTLSYKQRRSKHGALFSVTAEKFYPIDYRSLYNDSYIEDIIGGDTIDLVGIELGYKHNIGPLSFAVLGSISQGAIAGAVSAQPRDISVSKFGVSGNIALDALFQEPWVVPYFQVGAHQFNVTESDATTSQSATTNISFNYRYGIMFQLDWIENSFDKTAKEDRLRSSGLENTYLDIYISEYLASSDAIDPTSPISDGDPNMLSSGELGIGLKMEF